MKLQQQVTIILGFLIFVNSQSSCVFSIDQLNNQVLTTNKKQQCEDCFISDVKLTIQNNADQITSLKLTAVDANSPAKEVTLQPAQKSNVIDPFFLVQYTTGDNYEATNFMNSCQTQDLNGKFVYILQFNAKVNNNFQFFELNNGYPPSKSNCLLLQKFSLILIISMILLF